ncbi:MAG: hypothetical protein K5898_00150 [Ruminococcus sp.]|uniref:HEAT repeat domain-containing protein n=1 Tax=Ruminococcus sp. TaxID=41978 RepID=UPI0025D561D5|nr:hypothetical protein [Ruminococcus sp.]MCR4793596.1 hypothetical protein [Ruminococcus sp.]
MNDTDLLEKLMSFFKEKGYIINNHMDILKIKLDYDDIEVLKKYLNEFQEIQYKKFIVRCLSKRNIKNVSNYLINQYKLSNDNDYRWVVANALLTICDKSLLDSYIEIVLEKKYQTSRQMIVLLLGKIKKVESKKALLSLLDNHDYDVLSQTLNSLNNIIDDEIYKKIKMFISDSNMLIIKKDLILIKENNQLYNLVDIEGFIKLIVREANKGISKYEKMNR